MKGRRSGEGARSVSCGTYARRANPSAMEALKAVGRRAKSWRGRGAVAGSRRARRPVAGAIAAAYSARRSAREGPAARMWIERAVATDPDNHTAWTSSPGRARATRRRRSVPPRARRCSRSYVPPRRIAATGRARALVLAYSDARRARKQGAVDPRRSGPRAYELRRRPRLRHYTSAASSAEDARRRRTRSTIVGRRRASRRRPSASRPRSVAARCVRGSGRRGGDRRFPRRVAHRGAALATPADFRWNVSWLAAHLRGPWTLPYLPVAQSALLQIVNRNSAQQFQTVSCVMFRAPPA